MAHCTSIVARPTWSSSSPSPSEEKERSASDGTLRSSRLEAPGGRRRPLPRRPRPPLQVDRGGGGRGSKLRAVWALALYW